MELKKEQKLIICSLLIHEIDRYSTLEAHYHNLLLIIIQTYALIKKLTNR